MGLYVVHKEPEVAVYRASSCSQATLFILLTTALTVIVPLLLAYRSHGLWVKEADNFEMPDVTFKHEVLVVVHTSSSGPLVWSTKPAFNSLMENHLRIPLVKSYELDGDHDGVYEGLEFSLTMPLASTELVYGVTLLLTFDYRLHQVCELVLEGAGLLQYSSGLSMAALVSSADLTLHQRCPLPYGASHTLYNTSVLPSLNLAKDWKINNILTRYWERNITTRFTNTYTSAVLGESDSFHINLKVHYPVQRVTYIPGFWYMIKWAWMQYLSILVIVAYIVSLVKEWVFQNQLVSTWVEVTSKKL